MFANKCYYDLQRYVCIKKISHNTKEEVLRTLNYNIKYCSINLANRLENADKKSMLTSDRLFVWPYMIIMLRSVLHYIYTYMCVLKKLLCRFDPKNLVGEMRLTIPSMSMEMEYDVSGQLLIVPLHSRGYFRGNFCKFSYIH